MIHLMKTFFWFFFALLPLCLFSKKVLVLIVATDEKPIFEMGQTIWRSYMHLDPEHVEAYFIKSDPDLDVDYRIDGDIIWCKAPDTINPGIINKTLLAFECLAHRLHEFDFLFRTSSTVFCAFPRLLDYLETLPSTKCFCGPHLRCGDVVGAQQEWGGFYFGGPGLLFSIDLVELLLQGKDLLYDNTFFNDDSLMSLYLLLNNVPMNPTPMMIFTNMYWWWVHKDLLPEKVYLFRVDHDSNPSELDAEIRSTQEAYVLRELAKKFYGVSCPLEIDEGQDYEILEALWRSQRRPWGVWYNETFPHFLDRN